MCRASNCSLLPSANTQMSTHNCGTSIETARSHAVSYALQTSASMLMHSAVVYCGRSIFSYQRSKNGFPTQIAGRSG